MTRPANSDLTIDPEERSIALYQAARYSQYCRVFAPMYRQVTLTQLLKGTNTITAAMRKSATTSALSGWKDYLQDLQQGPAVRPHRPLAGQLHAAQADRDADRPEPRRSASGSSRRSCLAATSS